MKNIKINYTILNFYFQTNVTRDNFAETFKSYKQLWFYINGPVPVSANYVIQIEAPLCDVQQIISSDSGKWASKIEELKIIALK